MGRPPTPIFYYGGKSRLANWIVSKMPGHKSYAEPFAGVLSVLLAKPRVGPELVNDSNQWLVNWWQCVRDQGDELARLSSLTPRSLVLFEDACARVKQAGNRKASGIQDALDFQVIIQQGIMHGWGRQSGSWARAWCRVKRPPAEIASRIQWCASRLENVQIDCTDGVDLIARCKSDTLVYCDPPYYSADVTVYGGFEFDKDRFTEAVLASPALIMISGYPGEWDHLGWRCVEARVKRTPAISDPQPDALYCNFPPVQDSLL